MTTYSTIRPGFLAAACLVPVIVAHAAIVYSGPLELTVPENGAAIHFDLLGGQAKLFDTSSTLEGWSCCLYSSISTIEGEDWIDQETWAGLVAQPGLDTLARSDAPFDGLLRLDAGYALNLTEDAWYTGGGGLLNASYNGAFSNDVQWSAGSTGYIGLRLDGNPGWARVSFDADNSLTLHDFAYADGGEQLATGQTAIPEPSTIATVLGLLAGGFVACIRLRRRSKND